MCFNTVNKIKNGFFENGSYVNESLPITTDMIRYADLTVLVNEAGNE
jgi:hypothetical protein